MDPRRAIVPIVEVNAEKDVVSLAGTGFFVRPIPTLVTAGHVFRSDLAEGHAYAVAYIGKDGGPAIAQIADVVHSKKHDIAVIPKAQLPGIEPLELTPQIVPMTEDVHTYEYSSTRIVRDKEGKLHVYFHALTHKGNLMRASEPDDPDRTESPTWETSFPALQGASGAPVVAFRGGGVVGMLVANHERHLLPAQVLRIETGDGATEEVKYFLPHGIAIRAAAIGEFLLELGIDASTRDVQDWKPDWYDPK